MTFINVLAFPLLFFLPLVLSSPLSPRAPWIPVYLACPSELTPSGGGSYRLVEASTFSQYYQCWYWDNDPTKGDDQFCWYDRKKLRRSTRHYRRTFFLSPDIPLPPNPQLIICFQECNFSSGLNRLQTWFFDGSTLKLVGTNKCLDVTDGNTSNGAKLQVWTCVDGARNQQFYHWDHVQLIVPEDHISWMHLPGKCMDLTDGVVQDDTRIQMWDCSYQNPNQKWSVLPALDE
ncbi:ricin B lectin domain-containing protein [Flammula alnicola]|nr:ricin B lectin domain-containing protein [Flammula alnicola]